MFPLTLLPFYVDNKELVRLGSIDDGGYVVPIETITSSSMLISCGINDNWDFEKDFVKRSKTSVWAYDYSVDGKFWYSKFKKNLIVTGALFEISKSDEKKLDMYEDYPIVYKKYYFTYYRKKVMTYTMTKKTNFTFPSERYLNIIKKGYKDCDLDKSFLKRALKN